VTRRLAIPALVGLGGSVAIAASAIMVGRLPAGEDQWPARGPLAWVGRGSEVAANRWFVAGCLGLAVAWLAIVQTCRAAHVPAWAPLAVAAIWCVPLFFAPPVASGDVYAYAAQGRVSAAGADPYEVGAGAFLAGTPTGDSVDPFWASTPSSYGPLWIGVSEAVARAAGERPALAVTLFRLVAVAGVAAAAFAASAVARRSGSDPALVTALVAGSPIVVVHLVGGAHNDALMIGLAAVAVAAAASGSVLVGVAGCSLAAAVKAPAFVVLAVVASRAGGRRVAAVVAVAGGSFLAVTFLARVDFGWVSNLDSAFVVYPPLSITTDVGIVLTRAFERGEWLGDATTIDVVRAAGTVMAGGFVLLALGRARSDLVRATTLGLGALALLGPVVFPWYLTWLVPGAALLVARVPARSVSTCALFAASAAVAMAALPTGRSFVDPPISSSLAVVVVGAVVGAGVVSVLGSLVSSRAIGSSAADPVRLRPRRSEPR